MPHRFYCPDAPRSGRFPLGPDESHHLVKACRLGVGDRVEVFDGRGFATTAEVVASASDRVELAIIGEAIATSEPSCSLTLATAIPKGDRFDWLIEKATELGVERLIPVIAERSVVVPRGSKLERLRRTIIEASKQCRRSRLMRLEEPAEWDDLVASFPETPRFLADGAGRPGLEWPTIPPGGEVVLAVGPEGGFTGPEIARAVAEGWFPIRLGCHTLRVETAGLAGCAALLSRVAEKHE